MERAKDSLLFIDTNNVPVFIKPAGQRKTMTVCMVTHETCGLLFMKHMHKQCLMAAIFLLGIKISGRQNDTVANELHLFPSVQD